MAKSPVEVWLWLLLVMQPFNKKTSAILLNSGNDASKAGAQIRDGKIPFLNDAERRRAGEVRIGAVREVLKLCENNGIRVITLDDEEYPPLLKAIENPPIVLFCAGSLAGINDRATLAVVGTRNISKYGLHVAPRLLSPLVRSGTAIVSGLAVGADTAAHTACLEAGGRTVGVLGCGILVNYPKENAELKRAIVQSGGAVISELLPYAKSFPGYFHTRNRIISGLSHGTLILEAGEKSGSLLTAAHALDQGREIFCVPPHDIFEKRFAGVAGLLRSGAVPVYGYMDILDVLSENIDPQILSRLESEPQPQEESAAADEVSEKSETPLLDGLKTSERLAELDSNQAEVYKLLSEKPSGEDYLIDRLELDFGELTEILTALEIFGLIERNKDGLYTAT